MTIRVVIANVGHKILLPQLLHQAPGMGFTAEKELRMLNLEAQQPTIESWFVGQSIVFDDNGHSSRRKATSSSFTNFKQAYRLVRGLRLYFELLNDL